MNGETVIINSYGKHYVHMDLDPEKLSSWPVASLDTCRTLIFSEVQHSCLVHRHDIMKFRAESFAELILHLALEIAMG